MANLRPTQSIKGNIASGNAIHGNILPTNTIKGKISTEVTDASTTKRGIIRIATDEEAITGENNTIAITPKTLKTVTHYVHNQEIASEVWEIEHNLNKEPSVTIVDTANEEQIPDRKVYNSKNKVTLYFLSEFAGRAILN